MTLHITIDGVALDDPQGRWWASDRTGETQAPALRLATLNGWGGIGETDAPSPGYGAATWPLVVRFAGRDYDEAKLHQAELEATLLNRHGQVEIIKESSIWQRVAWGMVAAGTEVERLSYGQRLDVAYPVRIPRGRWFDTVEQSVTLGAASRVSGTDADGTYLLAALLGGSRDMDPIITTVAIGATTDVRVTDVASGQWVRVAGNITAGQTIIIDPINLTATANGVRVDGLLDFSPREFHLSPGARVRVVKNGSQPVTITARRAYT